MPVEVGDGEREAVSMPTMVGVSDESSWQSHSARPRRVQYRLGLGGGGTASGVPESSAA